LFWFTYLNIISYSWDSLLKKHFDVVIVVVVDVAVAVEYVIETALVVDAEAIVAVVGDVDVDFNVYAIYDVFAYVTVVVFAAIHAALVIVGGGGCHVGVAPQLSKSKITNFAI